MIMELKSKIAIIIIMIVLIAGCVEGVDTNKDNKNNIEIISTSSNYIKTINDEERNVTCWVYAQGYGGGISCLPDKQFME